MIIVKIENSIYCSLSLHTFTTIYTLIDYRCYFKGDLKILLSNVIIVVHKNKNKFILTQSNYKDLIDKSFSWIPVISFDIYEQNKENIEIVEKEYIDKDNIFILYRIIEEESGYIKKQLDPLINILDNKLKFCFIQNTDKKTIQEKIFTSCGLYDLLKQSKVNCTIIDSSTLSSNKILKLLSAEKGPKDGLKKPHGNTGRIFTEEHKKKISLSQVGKLKTKETKRKISVKLLGRKVSDQTRKKISKSHKGNNKRSKTKFKNRNTRPVMIGVDFFKSVSSAAKFYNISVGAVIYRCSSENFTGWNYASEDIIKNKIKEEDQL